MHKTAFFGRIPERAFALRAERALKSRDLELLGLVMTYAATGRDVVEARQRTLARRLSCSVRTVQRSLARLADQGLLTKQYRRDPHGRLLGLAYDVAPTLALMPRARAAHPPTGAADATKTPAPGSPGPSGGPPHPKRQKGHDSDERCFAQRDNTDPAPDSCPPAPAPPAVVAEPSAVVAEPSAVVAELIAVGVHRRVAATLAARFGDDRCRQVLSALSRRAGIRDRAAWCVGCLLENWDLTPAPTGPAAARPQAQHPYRCPAPDKPPDADPLDALPPGELLRLEAAARAQLLAEMPVLRASFERGRSTALIRARTRELLARSHTEGGRP